MNKKLFQTGLAIFLWGIFAFGMSILYYWMKDKGLIWDNPDLILMPDGNWREENVSWNSRKVILGIIGFSSFVLTVIRVVFIWS